MNNMYLLEEKLTQTFKNDPDEVDDTLVNSTKWQII